MFGLFIAIIGFVLISIALNLTLKEIKREAEVKFKPDASFYDGIERIDDEIQRLRDEVDGMNESFYEVVDSLNDRLNDYKRELTVIKKNKVLITNSVETNQIMDVTEDVRKSDTYHQYEMENHAIKSPKSVKEARVFPEQGVRKKIIELNNQGKSPSEIARVVEKGIGEVQLILNLLGKK